ncbi:MAG: rnc, ribonuclease III, ribonuclease III [Chloroflexi bacterium CSP1-4]|nr:MAG: rnc, ribonuclease III, ribonuclease III [Chloroflexi bacterium CSP1-4]
MISIVVSEALFRHHPGEDEGRLTARRSAIVSTEGLAALARRVELGDYLLLGQGADRANERERPSVLAAAFESVVGAIYLDLGLEAVRAWISDVAASELEARQPASSLVSPKSRLQEVGYARVGAAPTYRIVSAVGPDHEKHYIVEAIIEGEVVGRGEGRNRREAETAAAAAALRSLDGRRA